MGLYKRGYPRNLWEAQLDITVLWLVAMCVIVAAGSGKHLREVKEGVWLVSIVALEGRLLDNNNDDNVGGAKDADYIVIFVSNQICISHVTHNIFPKNY